MLKTMRKKENVKRIMWATVILIVPAFVLFYGWSSITSRNDAVLPYAAKIDSYEIPLDAFQQQYSDTIAELRNSYKQDVNEEVVKRMQLPEKVLDQMIGEYLMLREARKMGVKVDDNEIMLFITSNQVFAPGGRFDPRLYQEWLAQRGKTPSQFEAELRKQILQRKLQFYLQDFVKISDAEVKETFRKQYEQIQIAFLSFTPQEFMQPAKVAEPEMQKFYDQHKIEFTIPAQYRALYLTISSTEVAKSIPVTDAEIQQQYEMNQSEYSTPEQVHARHIIVQLPENASSQQQQMAQSNISQALTRVRSGEDFAKVAQEMSEDGTAKKGGDLGFFGHGEMDQTFEEVAFSTPVGKVTDIFQTKFGYHIVKVEAKKEARVKPLSEVKAEVAKNVAELNAEIKIQEIADEILRDSTPNPNLVELGEKYKFPVADTGFFSNSQIPGLGSAPEVFKVVENLTGNAIGGPLKTEQGILLVQLKEKKEATVPAFADVKDRIRIQLALTEAANVAGLKAKEADALVQKGSDLSEVAKQLGLSLKAAEPFTFFSYIQKENASRDVASAAFLLAPGKTSGLVEDKDPNTGMIRGYYILKVLGKSGIDEGKFLAEKERVLQALTEVRQKQAFQEWINTLTKRANIKRNEKLIQSFYG